MRELSLGAISSIVGVRKVPHLVKLATSLPLLLFADELSYAPALHSPRWRRKTYGPPANHDPCCRYCRLFALNGRRRRGRYSQIAGGKGRSRRSGALWRCIMVQLGVWRRQLSRQTVASPPTFRCHRQGTGVNHHDIRVSKDLDERSVAAAVEDACAAADLCLTMKTSLKKHPGCTHWHFKRPGQRGVLEVTWWPGDADIRPPRLWLSVHGNRQSDWISELMPLLRSRIEDQLKV